VEGLLADSNRRVRPDPVDGDAVRNIIRRHHPDVAEGGGVSRAQCSGPLVDVDGPHLGLGVANSEGIGDRAVATTHVDQHLVARRGWWTLDQKNLGPGVDLVGAEDPAIGDLIGSEVGKYKGNRLLVGRDGWLGVEILGHCAGTVAFVAMSSPYEIRVFGDPVLRTVAAEVQDIDGKLALLAADMLQTMYDEPGLGLAAPQVGVQKRLFVYDVGEGAQTLINPVVVESRDEWVYDEGCLSVPGMSFEIVRPKEIHLTGYDLDGNEVSIEADELLARLFQHELDHLDGVLLLDRLDDKTRKAAMKTLRQQLLNLP